MQKKLFEKCSQKINDINRTHSYKRKKMGKEKKIIFILEGTS